MNKVRLEDVCEILDSQRIPITASDRNKGIYPYYGANGIQDYVDDYLFDDELVLLAEDGGNFDSVDKPIAYRVSGKCWVNNHAHVLKAKSDINTDYLCYSLMFYNTGKLVNGATRKKLTQKAMRSMLIPLRSMEEQNKIVLVIKSVFEAIEKFNLINNKLDELIKSRFVEMFGDIEKKTCMSELCSIITDGTHQSPKFIQKGIPFLFVSNIVTNEITYNTDIFISEDTYSELYKRTPIEIGDIVLSTVGSYGHPAIVKSNRRFLFQRHIAYLKPISSIVNSTYLHSAILSNEVQRQIEDKVKGVAQKTLNLSEIRKIIISVPPISLQEQFADYVTKVEQQKATVQKSIEKLETLKKSLMQDYFR